MPRDATRRLASTRSRAPSSRRADRVINPASEEAELFLDDEAPTEQRRRLHVTSFSGPLKYDLLRAAGDGAWIASRGVAAWIVNAALWRVERYRSIAELDLEHVAIPVGELFEAKV